MISQELAEFVQGGVSMLVGTRDARLFPESARALGARVHEGRRELTVFLPEATGATTVANLRDNGRVAACFARIPDHKTLQLKGELVELGRAGPADRAVIDRYRKALAESFGLVGVPPRVTLRLAHWPCHAVHFRIESVFVQTPGPDAGEPLDSPGERGLP